jgi:hypothetical protein
MAGGGGDKVDNKLKADYKKRKLVEEVVEKVYLVRPGPGFTTQAIKKKLISGSLKCTGIVRKPCPPIPPSSFSTSCDMRMFAYVLRYPFSLYFPRFSSF